jgi:hypothetical protein
MTPCSLVSGYRYFGGIYCLYHHGRSFTENRSRGGVSAQANKDTTWYTMISVMAYFTAPFIGLMLNEN